MYYSEISSNTIIGAIEELSPTTNELLFFLVAEDSAHLFESIRSTIVKHTVKRFIGAVFPGVIEGHSFYTTGMLVWKQEVVSDHILYTDISEAQPLDKSPFTDFLRGEESYSSMVFIDGLTRKIDLFLKRLNGLYKGVRFIGGGAGALRNSVEYCLMDQDGLYKDAALVCQLQGSMALGVQHGWQTFEGPFVATKTNGNVIEELNWRPAFDVYQECLAAKEIAVEKDNFFEVAKSYPFGMFKFADESIVRDPIEVGAGNELICVGEVPNNTVLNILKGDKLSLKSAVERLTGSMPLQKMNHPNMKFFVVDCISRALFLGEDFKGELDQVFETISASIAHQEFEIFGVLSIGEISTFEKSTVEFYNKTFVLGAFPNNAVASTISS